MSVPQAATTSQEPYPTESSPWEALFSLLNGGYISHTVSVAARLGVADALASGPQGVTELAKTLGAHAPSLYRILRGLTDIRVVTELEEERFALTPIGELLRSDVPDSVRGYAIYLGMQFQRNSWTELYESVRTGESPFVRAHGKMLYDYLNEHPEDDAIFDEAMMVSAAAYKAVWEVYDFGRFSRLVDVGGGKGHILAKILAANPGLNGVLFDIPIAVADTGPVLSKAGVAERCQVLTGSFFDSVPAECDAYLLVNIVHGWDDASTIEILRNCRRAMTEDSTILLVENMLSEECKYDLSRLLDLYLLVMSPGGRSRTQAEFASLLEQAGFRLTRVLSAGWASVIEAVPISAI